MAFYYSASERAFFSSELMSVDAMPADRVSVTDSAYKQLMADQVAGKLIRTGSGNAPESVDQGLAAATRFGDVSFGKVTSTSIDLNGSGDVSGSWTVHGTLSAQGGLTVTDITATGTTTVVGLNAGNISASGTLAVNGNTTMTGKLTANGGVSTKALTATSLDLNGNGDVSGTLAVHGKTTLEDVQANGDVTVGGLLQVTGTATFKGAVTVPEPTNSGHAARKADVDALTTLTDDGVKVVGTPDYNALTDPGFYHCNSTGSQNGPGGAHKLIVLTVGGTTPKHITQVTFPITNNNHTCPAMRFMDSNGNWSDWEKIALTVSNEDLSARSLVLAGNALIGYKGDSASSVPNFGFEVEDYTKGDTPSKEITARYFLYGKGQSAVAIGALAGLMFGVNPDKSTFARLRAYKNQNGQSTSGGIDVTCDANGNFSALAPKTADTATGNEIAVASFTKEFGGLNYGVGGTTGTAIDSSTLWPSRDMNDIDKTGVYTMSGSWSNSPLGEESQVATGILYHAQRRFNAGTVAWQIMVTQFKENVFFYRIKNNGGIWSKWFDLIVNGQVNPNFAGLTTNGLVTINHSSIGTCQIMPDVEMGVIPSSAKFSGFEVRDKNNKRLAFIQFSVRQDGRREFEICVSNNDISADARIKVGYDQSTGSFYSSAPHPVTDSNDNSIATTGFSIGKEGNRGNCAGFEVPVVQATALTINERSRDSNLVTGAVKITVSNGAANQSWTKTVAISNASATISLGSSWKWYGGAAPDISANCVLVLHWCSTFGLASLLVTS